MFVCVCVCVCVYKARLIEDIRHHLYSIARLRGDSLHGQHDLKLHLAGEIPGGDLPQWGVRVYLVGHDYWPEHLEEVLGSVYLSAEVHTLQVVGDDLPLLSHLPLDHQPGDVRLQEMSLPGNVHYSACIPVSAIKSVTKDYSERRKLFLFF